MEQLKIQELYSDLSKTMAKELLESKIYPWEVLPEISAFLVKLGNALSEEEYEKEEKMCGLPNLQRWRQRPISIGPGHYWKRGGSPSLCFYPGEWSTW